MLTKGKENEADIKFDENGKGRFEVLTADANLLLAHLKGGWDQKKRNILIWCNL